MGKRFGDQAYAGEELVADIGAAFLCAELGITQGVRPDHAQYLATWLQMLKSDSRAIFTAAARASEASKYLRGLAGAWAPFLGVGLLPAGDAAQALFDAFEQSVAKFGRDRFVVGVKGLLDRPCCRLAQLGEFVCDATTTIV